MHTKAKQGNFLMGKSNGLMAFQADLPEDFLSWCYSDCGDL